LLCLIVQQRVGNRAGRAGRAKSAQTEGETLPLTDANAPICSRRDQEERSSQEG
jgi:hypothetical protein